MLQLSNITKDYIVGEQTVRALRGISLEFRKNEFVSVLGPSGCGKTTLMNIVGGLDKYTQGELFIDGTSTRDFEDKDWDDYRNKKIGFVFQSYNLIPHLNVLGNVEIALTISGVSKEERRKRAMAALDEVGLVDQQNQRPNQLSGGQMQRVAIARALVNSPEILLADEPTGALDTETSQQIMNLIDKISEDRLVIMVTHNPELAEKYSTRIINMLDGKITSDSKPYNSLEDKEYVERTERIKAQAEEDKKEKKIKNKQSSMSYLTALSLSWKNLITKKGRTVMTSIAGSIGIIGIALILAISGGMNNYISKLQTDTLAKNPITITTTAIDVEQMMKAMGNVEELEKFPVLKEIYVQKSIDTSEIISKNNITEEYIEFVSSALDSGWYSDITYKTGMKLNFYGIKSGQTAYGKLSTGSSMGFMGGGYNWSMLLKTEFIDSQYELLDGFYPENKNQLVIIVSDTNEISEETLVALGIKNVDDNTTKFSFDDVLGRQYKAVGNDLMYYLDGSSFKENSPADINFDQAETLEIVGILRVKEDTDNGVMSTGIGYLKELYTYMQDVNYNSKIVEYMNDNPAVNPLTGLDFESNLNSTASEQRESVLRSLGGSKLANEINVYPTSFEAKNLIKEKLNSYNAGREKGDMVTYTDMSELISDTMSSIVNTISYVLIAFTAISLVVSSIMIAIITYVSVLERTKEIGILRSIGSRKKDITRVFNAETIIIGFIAGAIGVGMAYLLSVPINIIIKNIIDVNGIASLSPLNALFLVVISVILTLVSGLIPALKAAKQDPVTALRTE